MEQGIRIRTVVLLCLLLSGVTCSYAQDYSTWGEIYDYDIGDIFHYRFEGMDYIKIENVEILNRTYTLDSNIVEYYQFVQEAYYIDFPPYYDYDEYYKIVTYSNLNSVFYADSIDSIQKYNFRKRSHYDFSQPPDMENNGHYVDGCGNAFERYWEYNHIHPIQWNRSLIYYKKGNEEWGTPHIVVGTPENKLTLGNVNTYPNPFTASTTIEYELTEPSLVHLTIYNAIGEKIYQAEDRLMPVGKHTFTWTPERLPEGMYYGVMRSEEGVSVVKMIKQ